MLGVGGGGGFVSATHFGNPSLKTLLDGSFRCLAFRFEMASFDVWDLHDIFTNTKVKSAAYRPFCRQSLCSWHENQYFLVLRFTITPSSNTSCFLFSRLRTHDPCRTCPNLTAPMVIWASIEGPPLQDGGISQQVPFGQSSFSMHTPINKCAANQQFPNLGQGS